MLGRIRMKFGIGVLLCVLLAMQFVCFAGSESESEPDFNEEILLVVSSSKNDSESRWTLIETDRRIIKFNRRVDVFEAYDYFNVIDTVFNEVPPRMSNTLDKQIYIINPQKNDEVSNLIEFFQKENK